MRRTLPALGSSALFALACLASLACDKWNDAPDAPVVDPVIAPLLTAKNLVPPPPPPPADSGVLAPPHGVSSAAATPPPRRGTLVDAAQAGASCGPPPLPDCPLTRWMKEHTVVAVLAPDFPELADAFRTIATFAPSEPGYPYWKSISLDGAAAAEVADLEAVHAGCRGCHTEYRAKYIAELRPRPVGP